MYQPDDMAISEDLLDTLAALNLSEFLPYEADSWDSTQSSLPNVAEITFLSDAFIDSLQPLLHIPDEALGAWIQASQLIRENRSLLKLTWHYHRVLYVAPEGVVPWNISVPDLRESMGELAGMFTVVVLFSGFHQGADVYKVRAIPMNVMEETFTDVPLWMNDYWRKFGRWGLETLWLHFHISGRLFRLGRLQFVPDKFHGSVTAYRHMATGEIVALLNSGIEIRQDGQINGTSGIYETCSLWTSEIEHNGNHVFGTIVTPDGQALHRKVLLDLGVWEQVLTSGDVVIDIHIPEGGKLSMEQCAESIVRAKDFFLKYFPELKVNALTCSSWLLDSQLRDLLPPSSNIVQFQRQFYTYPIRSSGNSIFERVFGVNQVDVVHVPCQTQLQKALYQHVVAGGSMREAGGFMLIDSESVLS